MNKSNIEFIWKLIRNILIMSGMYFFANFANFQSLTIERFQMLIWFIGMYFFAELGHHFHVSPSGRSIKMLFL